MVKHKKYKVVTVVQSGEDTALGDQTYRYLTADEMKSLGDDSLPIDVTRDERIDSNKMVGSIDSNMLPPQHIEDSISPEHVSRNYTEYIKKYTPDNVDINRHPINIGFLVSFLVDARGGAMRGCRHSGVRVIVPPRCAPSPTRITCRYVRPQRTPHPPPLMEGEALASRVLELGPVGAKFLGPVIIEVPHFAALRGKEREIVILRSDNGESWKEHTVDATEEILNEVLHESFEAEDLNQMEDISSGRITRIVTQDFPQYFAVVSRIRQEVHAIGPEGGMVSSTVVPQVQAIFPEGALTKKIKVGLQAQPIDPELTAKLLGHGVAVSPVVTVEPRRRKFHKAIRLNMPAPTAHSQGMINQYSGSAPTLRLLCSITGGTTRAQWEDVTGSTPLTFVNDVVSFTTTVSARFWLMDCRNIGDATKMATELYKEAIHVPFMAKFVVFAKRVDPLEARLRVFCMTDDKEDKTLEHQEHFTEVAKSRDVEVLEGKPQYIEFAGNLVPITKSGEQLQFSFRAFRENRLPFSVRVKDQHAEAVGRCLFMREAKVPKGEPPQQPICILNIVLPDDIVTDTISLTDSESGKRHMYLSEFQDYYRPDPRLADMSNLLGEDWVELAHQLGLTSSEINVIKSEYPESIAKQAQSMLRMWLSQSGNKAQTNTLENALRRIGREDIIPQCLNVEQPTHTFTRIKEEEIGYRLRRKDDRDVPDKKKIIEHYDKYSAEEKVVEKSESEEEDDFDKTVTERREKIEKRLSAERAIPASSQRREIVQEISDIKRQSLVEDKIAEVKQKVEPESKTKPDAKTHVSETIEVKTTSPSDSKVSERVSPELISNKIVETHKIVTETITHKPGEDTRFMEEVSSRFEGPTKKVEHRVLSSEDAKSPNFSKTPPPSPADFLIQKQAASAQEWDASRKPAEITAQTLGKDAAQQEISCGLTHAEPSLTTTDSSAPQPKPRTTKPEMPLDFSKTLPKTDKIVSPVRDDLLDNDEDEFATYSDRKKFWENVSKESAHKRMSLHEVTSSEKETVSMKRVSIHEVGQPPIPKPRSTLPTAPVDQSVSEESAIIKEKTVAELKIDKAIEAEKIHAQEELTSIIEGIENTDKKETIMTEYQAPFMPPSERKEKFKISESSQQSSESQIEKDDSLDSDKAQKGSSQLIEHTGYISDSEDVENVISDSEIEDRVPQIRERQMSVFAPPVTQRKSIYERSASLPTEDLYEVSRNLKHLKEKYEQKIKEDMIEEQFVTDNEEVGSPERKTLALLQEERISAVKSYVDEAMSKIAEEEHLEESPETSFVPIRNEQVIQEDFKVKFGQPSDDIEMPKSERDFEEIEPKKSVSVKDLAKSFEKQISTESTSTRKSPIPKLAEPLSIKRDEERKVEHDITVSSIIPETHKETVSDIQQKVSESELSMSPDKNGDFYEEQRYRDESCISKESMEVHVDKSELEDSEKIEIEQETDFESKSLDSATGDQQSPRPASEDIPEITVTFSGKQRRISEESDEYSDKAPPLAIASPVVEVSEQPEEDKPVIKQSEEHIQDTVWEATVETQSDFNEKVDVLIGAKEQRKLTEEFIATEKVFEEKDQLAGVKDKDLKGDASDFEEIPSVEEDEFSQVEHIVKRQSVSDFKTYKQQFADHTDGFIDHELGDKASVSKKDDSRSIKENISEKLTKEIHDKLNEKLKTQDNMIEKAVSEEVDDKTFDQLKELMVEEALEVLQQQKVTETDKKGEPVQEKDDDLSSGLREESDLGSEIHMDHSDSIASDRVKSESHSEIEKIILDTFQHMKVDPEEAKKIASQLIEEIENEIQNRGELTKSEATEESMVFDPEMSSYIKQLAETNGLDEREVELVESVLARRQRELSKLARGDTQASSMEITDEDLRYSGGEIADYTHTLEQQVGQLEAEKLHDLVLEYELLDHEKDFHEKSESYDKIDEKHKTEKLFSEDSESYDDSKIKVSKKTVALSIADSVKGEKSHAEEKNVILEEDETISESSVEEHSKIKTHIDSAVSEASLTKTDEAEIQEIKSGTVVLDSSHKSDVGIDHKEIKSDKIEEELIKEKVDQSEVTQVSGKYTSDRISKEMTGEFLKELKSTTEKEYDELVKKDEKRHKEELTKFEKFDDGTEVSTNIIVDKQHFASSSEVLTKDKSKEKVVIIASKTLEGTDLSKLLEGEAPIDIDTHIKKTETVQRTSSSDSKSSLDSGKSPDKKESFGKEHVILRKTKSEMDSSSSSSNLKPDRRSGVEFETYSSSGESHYQSFEMDSGKSRPCSSDVEGIVAAASSEYETALTSTQEYSAKSHVTSTDYHTAISSLSSKESMKSLDSESSGNLASVEVSEHSETLVPSSSDLDGDILDSIDQQILEDAEPSSGWTGHRRAGRQVSDLTDSDMVNESIDISEEDQNEITGKSADVMSKMKRSAEMTFQPEPKVLAPESPQLETNEVDERYGQSLDDGSILSMSVSSTSSTGAQRTVIEVSDRLEGSITASGISEHLSLEDTEITMRGSQESLPLTPTLQKTYDIATSTPQLHPELPIEHVTITTSSVKEDGIHCASTQITSEIGDIAEGISALEKISLDEPRKKGHRRTESTMIGISLPTRTLDLTLKEAVTDDKKEKEVDESEKDIDEKEQSQIDVFFDNEDVVGADLSKSSRPISAEFSDMAESELVDLMTTSNLQEKTDPIERPTSPEPQDTIGDIEQEFSSKTKEVALELQRKRSTSSISDTSKEILEKRDSHGKSSSTSSEKSSFEEAEAEAAFNMVAHISPAHKVKQIIPILEDDDAEKRELELREKQRKELEEKRAQMRDVSPGFIPDITVTDMTPDSEHDSKEEDGMVIISPQDKPSSSTDDDDSFEKIAEESTVVQECIKKDLQKETYQTPIEDEILTSSMMQSTLVDSVVTESTTSDVVTVVGAEKPGENDVDSQSSDSFEMLEKPDIIDDFVVIEEVGKEAHEYDTEGKSVKIDKTTKKVKKHDEEIERYLAHSAPTPLTGTTGGSSMDEFGFEFEDSPPRPEGNGGVASTQDYGYEYDRELEANKKWIEQQFQGDQAAMIAAGYGYEMEFERGPLEDIKEEDINDFAASSYGSQKESGGSLGSVKDSYSSTPDYDVLAGRKYFTRSGEQDDISMNSLQEFEKLEQAMSLEMRKFHQSQASDSSSSGSSKTRLHHGKNNTTGDDISVSSLKEFEGLEHACIQAHKIEIKAKEEEAMLAQIEEGQESIASESESCETVGTEKKITDTDEEEDYEKRMFEIDEIIKQAQSNVERFIDLREIEKTESLGRGDSIEEVSKVPDLELDTPTVKSTIKVQWKENENVMITSTDSLDFKQEEERRDSTDSLDAQPIGDVMTASTDSIEFQAQRMKDNIMTDSIEIRDEKSYMISSDSLEFGQATSSGLNVIQTDSIDEDGSRIGGHDHSSASTGKDFSSSAREEALIEPDKEDIMLHSIESMDPTSSTATHATMQYESDSVFSGSFTSGGSNTMVSSTDTIDTMQPKEIVDVGVAARKVWFDDDFSGRRITEYVEESSRPYISETIEPMDDEQFSHTIHRKVELAPEVRKVTFTGPDADQQLQKFLQDFNEGEDVQETQEVDEYGNVHTRRVVQKRFIIKEGEGEQPMTEKAIEEYFRQLNQSEVVQDRGVISRTTESALYTKEISDGKGTVIKKFEVPSSELTSLTRTITGEEHIQSSSSQQGASSAKASVTSRRPFRYEISMEDQTEVNLREHDWRFNLPRYAEAAEAQAKPDKDKSKKVSDQHQLSDEMKELLKEMEKESKQ